METPKLRKQRRAKTTAFYPSPASFSEADAYEYSSDDDDESDYDEDGFKRTLVRQSFVIGMYAWEKTFTFHCSPRLSPSAWFTTRQQPLVADENSSFASRFARFSSLDL